MFSDGCFSISVGMGAGEDPPLDRLRAAARLVGNHGAIAKFAARGCGKPGRRPVSAPLSDPTATAGENFLEAVDAGMLPYDLLHCLYYTFPGLGDLGSEHFSNTCIRY